MNNIFDDCVPISTALIHDRRLCTTGKVIYGIIAGFADGKVLTNALPQTVVAKLGGCTPGTLRLRIRELVDYGYLKVHRKSRRKPCVYELPFNRYL